MHHVDIAAATDTVWDLVRDVRRMSEWSPDVVSTRLRNGFDRVDLGTEFTNLNRVGDLEWKTHGEIVRYEPPHAIAYRIAENSVIWSMTLDAVPAGCRLTQRRERES